MRGTRVKQLRAGLFKEWPMLLAKHGRSLKSFGSVLRVVKKGYKRKFREGGWEYARPKMEGGVNG